MGYTYENRYTGQIETRCHLWLNGADDSDYGYTNALSEVWVWYQMPAAGMVEDGCIFKTFRVFTADAWMMNGAFPMQTYIKKADFTWRFFTR